MKCPVCRKRNPKSGRYCAACGNPLSPSANASRFPRIAVALIAAAVVLTVAVTICLLWRSSPDKEALVGTWKMEAPVRAALDLLAPSEDNAFFDDLTAAVDEDMTVTVYCRFFEDDTYALYADADEVIAVAEKAVDAAAAYLCDEGIDQLLASKDISQTTFSLILNMVDLSKDDLEKLVGGLLDNMATPLYDTWRQSLIPPTDKGTHYYLLENDRLFMGLQETIAVEDGAYMIWQFDGETLCISSGTFLDSYLSGCVWEKVN